MSILEKIGYWVGAILIAFFLSSIWPDVSLIIFIVVLVVAIVGKDKAFFNRELMNKQKEKAKARAKELEKEALPNESRRFSSIRRSSCVKKFVAWVLILLVATLIVFAIQNSRSNSSGYMSFKKADDHARGTGILTAIVFLVAFFVGRAVCKRIDTTKEIKTAKIGMEIEQRKKEEAKLAAEQSHDNTQ